MKNNSRKAFVKFLSLFTLLTALLLTGCGKQSSSEENAKSAGSAASEAMAYIPDTGLTEYSCENEIAAENLIYVQLDINPSYILGMTKDYMVVSIVANNEDAEDVMLNCLGDYFAGVSGGIELEYVIRDLAEATKQGGYIEDTFDVSVTVLSGEIEESTLDNAFDSAATELAENAGIETSYNVVAVDIDDYSEDRFDEGHAEAGNNEDNPDHLQDQNSDEEDKTCDLCHGECTIICDLCNGEGEITETEEREVEVRNDYVCPYCGGVGILDDGMHGGQTAVCGHCGGEGKTGPMSGDFRELAFDTEIIEEEVIRPCPRCNGAGTMPCPHCNGTGMID